MKTQIANLHEPIISLAINANSNSIVLFGDKGTVEVIRLLNNDSWTKVESQIQYIYSIMKIIVNEDYDYISTNFVGDVLFMSICEMFRLKDGSRTCVVSVDFLKQNHHVLVRGNHFTCPPDPVGVAEKVVFAGLHDGVAILRSPENSLQWIELPDGEDSSCQIHSDGVMYSNENGIVIVYVSIEDEADQIRVYTLDSKGLISKVHEYQPAGQTEDWDSDESDLCRGCCISPYSMEFAYLMSQDEWFVDYIPEPDSIIHYMDLYVSKFDGTSKKIKIKGIVGKNIGFQVKDIKNEDDPDSENVFNFFQLDTKLERTFVLPLSKNRYVLGLPGGTLSVVNSDTENQETIQQFSSEISAMKIGFQSNSVIIGLVSGEVYIVNIS